MSETFFVADTHLDHEAIRRHCNRPFPNLEEMNNDIVTKWNGVATTKDTIYIVGDFAWKNHRKWINMLNGKKILIIGNHDKMPQDALDLFVPDWTCEDVGIRDAIKTMRQFRETHHLLDRVICGQRMTLCHFPMRSWSASVHGTWCVCGHSHGRLKESLPGETGGGLLLDVGWDVWGGLVHFDMVKKEMEKKKELLGVSGRGYAK